jgi:hypothetical protein
MFRPITKVLAGVGALAALGLGGAALAGATTSSSSSTTPRSSPTARPPANFPAHGAAAHEDAEKAVTGDAAAKAQAAAVKRVGGGTAGAVTTDFTGNGFEVTVTKTDGTKVEVHLDSSYNVVQGPGGRGGRPPGGSGARPPAGSGGRPPAGGLPPAGAGGQPPAGY